MARIVALQGLPAGRAVPGTTRAAVDRPGAEIRLELRPLAACETIERAWTQLAARAIAPNPFFEPGFCLPAAQHLVAFRDAVAILAWQGEADEPDRRLLGFLPCFPRNGLFAPDALMGLSDRRIHDGTPLLDARRAGPVIQALLSRRHSLPIAARGLILRALDLDGPLIALMGNAAKELDLSVTSHPTGGAAMPGTPAPEAVTASRQALARQGKLSLDEPATPAAMRDAIEIVLAMEASGTIGKTGRAVLQDTREVSFLRAMTRRLARVKQCRVLLLMLDGQPIAGAIVIGRARQGWLYMTAQADSHAGLRPAGVLLAMMRQETPARSLRPGHDERRAGALHLTPRAATRPRDLATRMRGVLTRSLFSRARAAAR